MDKTKPINVWCLNCHRNIVGWQDAKGVAKCTCPYCGTVTVTKVLGRKHMRYDVYAPSGQVLLSNYN